MEKRCIEHSDDNSVKHEGIFFEFDAASYVEDNSTPMSKGFPAPHTPCPQTGSMRRDLKGAYDMVK